MAHNTVELVIPSRAEWVSVARLTVAGIANRVRVPIEDIDDLKLAVAEACTHCIQHAAGSGELRISFLIEPPKLRITVSDSGKDAGGRSTAKRQEPKEDGLGVFIIRSLMDEVAYEFDPQSGTTLTMTKVFGN